MADKKKDSAGRHEAAVSRYLDSVLKQPSGIRGVDLSKYYDLVYQNAPGGLDAALDIAQKHGSKVSRASLSRRVPVVDDKMSRSTLLGEHDPVKDVIKLAPHDSGPMPEPSNPDEARQLEQMILDKRRHTLRHELSHAADVVPGFLSPSPAVPVKSSVPSMGDYYGSSPEVRAEHLSAIKHWGAARGILPKNETEAKRLFLMHRASNPELYRDNSSRGKVWKLLKNTPGLAKDLLNVVHSDVEKGLA